MFMLNGNFLNETFQPLLSRMSIMSVNTKPLKRHKFLRFSVSPSACFYYSNRCTFSFERDGEIARHSWLGWSGTSHLSEAMFTKSVGCVGEAYHSSSVTTGTNYFTARTKV